MLGSDLKVLCMYLFVAAELEGHLRYHLLNPQAYKEEGDDTLHGTEELEEVGRQEGWRKQECSIEGCSI